MSAHDWKQFGMYLAWCGRCGVLAQWDAGRTRRNEPADRYLVPEPDGEDEQDEEPPCIDPALQDQVTALRRGG